MKLNSMRHILYKLNESNSNNPANLLVGSNIDVNRYKDNSNELDDSFVGVIELITNTDVVVKDIHTQDTYNFIFNGFNAHENGIEFINDKNPNIRFYVY